MNQLIRNILSLVVCFSLQQSIISQTANFIEGIKNDWSFFTDRIIYSDNSGIFYRLNNDTNLYYSDGTSAGTKATGYIFSSQVFTSPDFSVFSHDNNYTALGTSSAPFDIIIFKDKSSTFEYVEKAVGAFNGMTFFNGRLYYIYAPTGSKSTKLMEYDPIAKTKKEILTFESHGAFGISVLKDKLIVIAYKDGNNLLSINPTNGTYEAIYNFDATNSFATFTNMMVSEDKMYFWYPNNTFTYSLYVTEGVKNSTLVLLNNIGKYDPFVYYAQNVLKVGGGKIIARVKDKDSFNVNYAYFSDGTVAGTTKLQYKDVQNFNPYDFEYFCNRFYFSALDETGVTKLFSTDGTSLGTTKLSDVKIGSLVKFNNRLYMNGEPSQTAELYAWDDKAGKIVFVLDVNKMARESDPREFATTKDKLFMTAVKSNLDISYNLAVMTEPTRNKEECIASSLFDIESFEFNIFPNPFSSGFTINKEITDESTFNVTITDLMGNVIVDQINVKFPFEQNTNEWAPGMYIVKFTSRNQSLKTIRLIKIN